MSRHLLQRVRAISFDLDDTLWDCAPVIEAAEQNLRAWLRANAPALPSDDDHLHEAMRGHARQIRINNPDLQDDVSEMRLAILRATLNEAGYPENLAQAAFDFFYEERSKVTLYEGTHELLQALTPRYRLAAITNGNADLHRIGLAGYFDDYQRATLTLAPKPHKSIFERCLANLALPADALLHIGDNPQTDVVGGHNAGALTVWFNQYNASWPDRLPAPHFEVASLRELQQLLLQD